MRKGFLLGPAGGGDAPPKAGFPNDRHSHDLLQPTARPLAKAMPRHVDGYRASGSGGRGSGSAAGAAAHSASDELSPPLACGDGRRGADGGGSDVDESFSAYPVIIASRSEIGGRASNDFDRTTRDPTCHRFFDRSCELFENDEQAQPATDQRSRSPDSNEIWEYCEGDPSPSSDATEKLEEESAGPGELAYIPVESVRAWARRRILRRRQRHDAKASLAAFRIASAGLAPSAPDQRGEAQAESAAGSAGGGSTAHGAGDGAGEA
jgi:hypothetical protein